MTAAEPPVERVGTEHPRETAAGSARAVAAGDWVLVAGTPPLVDGVLQGESDPYVQTRTALREAVRALESFGLGAESVVRTRAYLTHARDADAVERAHKDVFDTVRPAMTRLVVSALVDAGALVEVEIEAYRGGRQ